LAPLLPYVAPIPVERALVLSAAVTLVVLTLFGASKARFTGLAPLRGAGQTVLLGGLAAGVAFALARLISGLRRVRPTLKKADRHARHGGRRRRSPDRRRRRRRPRWRGLNLTMACGRERRR
jgi:hypothetical protein